MSAIRSCQSNPVALKPNSVCTDGHFSFSYFTFFHDMVDLVCVERGAGLVAGNVSPHVSWRHGFLSLTCVPGEGEDGAAGG